MAIYSASSQSATANQDYASHNFPWRARAEGKCEGKVLILGFAEPPKKMGWEKEKKLSTTCLESKCERAAGRHEMIPPARVDAKCCKGAYDAKSK